MDQLVLEKDYSSIISESLSSDILECEFRFGKFKKESFDASVFANVFFRVKTHLEKFGMKREVCDITEKVYKCEKGQVKWRRTIKEDNTSTISIIKKDVIKRLDNYEYNFRLALSREKEQVLELSESDCIEVREKKRYTYIDNTGILRYDLTIVSGQYYIEMELLKEGCDKMDKQEMLKVINERVVLCLQMVQDSFKISVQSKVDNILASYNKLTRQNYFIGAQPECLNQSTIEYIKNREYSVTVKADGERTFVYINAGEIILMDNNLNIKETGIRLVDITRVGDCILDAEMVVIDGKFVYFIFDVLYYKGTDLRGDTRYKLKERLKIVEEIVKVLNETITNKYKFEAKVYYLENISLGCAVIESLKYKFKTDGVIFTPMDECYPKKKKWGTLLKWKDAENSTIDFYSIKKENKNGSISSEWNLYVQGHADLGNDKQGKESIKVLFDISKLTKSIKKDRDGDEDVESRSFETEISDGLIDPTTGCQYKTNTVIEYKYNKECGKFIPIRTRWDKTQNESKHGNYYKVACDIWRYIHMPISYGELKRIKSKVQMQNYKSAQEDLLFKNMRRFNNEIKREQYNNYTRNNNRILELCSGRGGDIQKWMHNNIKRVDCFDISKESVKTAMLRYTELKSKNNNIGEYNFYECDLTILSNFEKQCTQKIQYDNIICNFGLHYLYNNTEQFKRLILNLESRLKESGKMIISIIDSEMLYKEGPVYHCIDGEIVSYYNYSKSNVESKGGIDGELKIYTKDNSYLSFNNIENVLDKGYIIDTFEKCNMRLKTSTRFIDYYNSQKKYKLKDHELSISKLYTMLVFEKGNETILKERIKAPQWDYKINVVDTIINLEKVSLLRVSSVYELYDYINMYKIYYDKYSRENMSLDETFGYKKLSDILSKHNLIYYDNLTINGGNLEYKNTTDEMMSSVAMDKKYTIIIGRNRRINQKTNAISYIYYLVLYKNSYLHKKEMIAEMSDILKNNIAALEEPKLELELELDSKNSHTAIDIAIESIPLNLEKMTIVELKNILKEYGLSQSGRKSELIERIKQKDKK
jgi:2-polyprenyl-3-methyl-5-hydroxy-6-metoxy-1,4-benzoquinol methylase